MVEYRHNKNWGTMFFRDIHPEKLQELIEEYAEIELLGDIEVIDVQLTSTNEDGYVTHNALVFYAVIDERKQTKKVEV